MYEKCVSSGEVLLESLSTLKELFETVLRNSTNTFIIVDGIDECEPPERKLFLTFLNGIMSSIEKEGSDSFKVLYISRDEGDIQKLLSKVSRRTITKQDSEEDIKDYTTSQSVEIQEKFEIDDRERENIVSMVCERARGLHSKLHHVKSFGTNLDTGMFLYAHLVMINLLDQTTSQELMNELSPDNFPDGLGQA